jgi:hypothetical protein
MTGEDQQMGYRHSKRNKGLLVGRTAKEFPAIAVTTTLRIRPSAYPNSIKQFGVSPVIATIATLQK